LRFRCLPASALLGEAQRRSRSDRWQVLMDRRAPDGVQDGTKQKNLIDTGALIQQWHGVADRLGYAIRRRVCAQ
jgi:hypothetical protein